MSSIEHSLRALVQTGFLVNCAFLAWFVMEAVWKKVNR